MKGIFGGLFTTLERSLELVSLRHNLVASNIANEETPGYKAQEVDFYQEMKKQTGEGGLQLAVTKKSHLSAGPSAASGAEVFTPSDSEPSLDGNSVTLEKEMTKVAENTMIYNATITLLNRKFAMLRDAIKEGR
ncbi:MAG: flagellar basal body rod protein FlgB [Deltaproteobacteria bacterium]|nr:flagellar basal body rod protein FlgB [Deltaproteobacteria bacterium]